jgi:predicted nucleic acid-binding protein
VPANYAEDSIFGSTWSSRVSALVVDTSSWSRYFRGEESGPIEDALGEGRVYLPVVVAAELLSAKMTPRRRGELETLLGDLPPCGVDRDHWLRVGHLRAALFARGVSVSTPDAHIAQCTIDLDGSLLSHDGIFRIIAKHASLRLIEV